MSAVCCVCGCGFEPRNPRRPAKTCSRACTNKMVWRANPDRKRGGPKPKPRVIADCAWCGKPVKWAQRPCRQGVYCSRTCAGRAKTTGGLVLCGDGRWRVVHRDGSKQLYSRALMEAHLRRELTYNEVVHHVNGDPTDDRIENLVVMSRSDHTSMHSREWWANRKAEELLRSMTREAGPQPAWSNAA